MQALDNCGAHGDSRERNAAELCSARNDAVNQSLGEVWVNERG